jgi:hypothetical protein
MSNQLSIQSTPSDTAALSRGIAPAPTLTAPTAKPVPLFVNPSFQFDPTVGLVVIEFHNDKGTLTNSIPSQRQLEAYRTHRDTLPGEQPPPTANGKTAPG